MPTKLSLTLDAAQYQQQLDAVVRQTRQAAAQMETLNTDRQVTVTADTAPAEQAIEEIPEAPDQQYTVTGTVNAPDVPAAADQAYTIIGQLDAPDVPQAADLSMDQDEGCIRRCPSRNQ